MDKSKVNAGLNQIESLTKAINDARYTESAYGSEIGSDDSVSPTALIARQAARQATETRLARQDELKAVVAELLAAGVSAKRINAHSLLAKPIVGEVGTGQFDQVGPARYAERVELACLI